MILPFKVRAGQGIVRDQFVEARARSQASSVLRLRWVGDRCVQNFQSTQKVWEQAVSGQIEESLKVFLSKRLAMVTRPVSRNEPELINHSEEFVTEMNGIILESQETGDRLQIRCVEIRSIALQVQRFKLSLYFFLSLFLIILSCLNVCILVQPSWYELPRGRPLRSSGKALT